ncbi:pullulanase [Bacillus coahuilensis p1.1.43]|uniref:Pullulanase n=1 Tax=Bacillus coahuilensis p1.1.43 TaxID=1150625 RepID=A0A147K6R2_9BACI|nr:pullulanase [Bacillus coahuilensis p1.1.43]
MLKIERTFEAYLDGMNTVTILLPRSYHDGESAQFTLLFEDKSWPITIESVVELDNRRKYVGKLTFTPNFGQTYYVLDERNIQTDLQIGSVIRTDEFDEMFYYDGELGALYSENQTSFLVWAPTATHVRLKLIHPVQMDTKMVSMTREAGVWSHLEEGNLDGYYYSFIVCVNQQWKEVVDPYAKSVTAGSKLGVVIDMEKTKKLTALPSLPPTQCSIYELHVRDATIHPNSGVRMKGKYKGLTELETISKDGLSTGLSYLKELGVTHIELLPLNDFEGVDDLHPLKQYNWGYNPLFFNAPEGSYSTNPKDPYNRIHELKEMIDTFHQQGLRVIQDVVYNHVYIQELSSFELLVPGYFFRHDGYGNPSDGTGVGNDFASEKKMARKFIVDSVTYWLTEYGIDGFRFDLMGNLDIETMLEVSKVAEEMVPGLMLLGEGWDLQTTLPKEKKAIIANASSLPTIAFFNDQFRDTIKGSTFNMGSTGFALGEPNMEEKVLPLLLGEGKLAPIQSVNYVESHDNHTLWDKIQFIYPNDQWNIKRHQLATAMTILAPGIPFLHAGQEFFRTKEGIGNSYNAPDRVNRLDWRLRELEDENVQFIKGLLRLRRENPIFHVSSHMEGKEFYSVLKKDNGIIAIHYKGLKAFSTWEELVIVYHNRFTIQELLLPEGKWNILVEEQSVSTSFHRTVQTILEIQPLSLYVLGR